MQKKARAETLRLPYEIYALFLMSAGWIAPSLM